MAQVRAKTAAKLAAAREAVTGAQPALRSDVGEVVATTLSANVALNNQNPISNGLTAAAITGMGEIASSALNQVDQAFAVADAHIIGAKESISSHTTPTSYHAENLSASVVRRETNHSDASSESVTRTNPQQEGYIGNSRANTVSGSGVQQNQMITTELVSEPHDRAGISPQEQINNQQNNQQMVHSIVNNTTEPETNENQGRASSCTTPNMSRISDDLPHSALASLKELKNRLDIAISDYKSYCRNDAGYAQTLLELNQAYEQTQKACEQISVNGICQ